MLIWNQKLVGNVENPSIGSWDSIIIGIPHIMEVLTFDKFLLIRKFEERIKKDSRSMGLIQTGGKT